MPKTCVYWDGAGVLMQTDFGSGDCVVQPSADGLVRVWVDGKRSLIINHDRFVAVNVEQDEAEDKTDVR